MKPNLKKGILKPSPLKGHGSATLPTKTKSASMNGDIDEIIEKEKEESQFDREEDSKES